MSLEDFQLLDNELIGNSILQKDFFQNLSSISGKFGQLWI